jgi:hypothetical protein
MRRGQHAGLFAHALFGPFDRDVVVAGVSLNPALVIAGAPAENLLVHHRQAEDPVEEVNHLFGPGQPAQVAVANHNDKCQVADSIRYGISADHSRVRTRTHGGVAPAGG